MSQRIKQDVVSIGSADTEVEWTIPDSVYKIKIQARGANDVRIYFSSSNNDFTTTDNSDSIYWTVPANNSERFEGSFSEGSQDTMYLQSPDGATKVEIQYVQGTAS